MASEIRTVAGSVRGVGVTSSLADERAAWAAADFGGGPGFGWSQTGVAGRAAGSSVGEALGYDEDEEDEDEEGFADDEDAEGDDDEEFAEDDEDFIEDDEDVEDGEEFADDDDDEDL